MKKAFTVIELIFVIVILGILAAIAIPKLATTRDDAVVVRTARLLTQSVSDFAGYYISQGKFSDNIENMTNVSLPIRANSDICATFERDATDENKIVLHRFLNTTLCKRAWELSNFKEKDDIIFSNGFIVIETK